MSTRLTAQPEFGHKTIKVRRISNLKRKVWLAVFTGSALFWLAVALMIWHL